VYELTEITRIICRSMTVLCGLCLYGTVAHAEDDCRVWHGARQTEQGTLLHRCVGDSPIDEVMIETRLQADPQRVFALVNDYEAFEEFIPDVADSRVLEQQGTVQWVYHRLHFPGPVMDRVYILKSSGMAVGAQHWRVNWALSGRKFPHLAMAEGIRPSRLSGFWEIRSGERPGWTSARYAVHTDPGGRIPAWLVMRMTDRYVQQVVEAVRRRLEEPHE
jgi:hypothetical protein